MKNLSKSIPPILTNVERDAIASPVTGEIIYNPDVNGYEFWNGAVWSGFFVEGGVIEIPPEQVGGGASSMVVSFASGGSKHVSSTSPTYESLAHIIYAGTDAVGPITNFNVNVWVTGASGQVRIVDLSTGLTIVELTGILATGEENIQNMGVITNLPTTETIFEIQGSKTGGGIKVFIGSIEMTY